MSFEICHHDSLPIASSKPILTLSNPSSACFIQSNSRKTWPPLMPTAASGLRNGSLNTLWCWRWATQQPRAMFQRALDSWETWTERFLHAAGFYFEQVAISFSSLPYISKGFMSDCRCPDG